MFQGEMWAGKPFSPSPNMQYDGLNLVLPKVLTAEEVALAESLARVSLARNAGTRRHVG